MGTSSSFKGPKRPLVPSWADDPPPEPVAPPPPDDDQDTPPDDNDATSDTDTEQPPAPYPPMDASPVSSGFGTVRGSMTSGARRSDAQAIQRGAGRYVAASGGGAATARRLRSSRAAAEGIATFARQFVESGPSEALRQFNLQALIGAPAVEVFTALTEVTCPPGGTIDEAIARDAMLETIADLAAAGVGDFEELTQSELEEFFIGFVSRSIEGKILNDVGTNTVSLSPDIAAVERAQRMLHDFVDGCVRDRFSALPDGFVGIQQGQVEAIVGDLYAASLDLVQTLGDI